MTRSNFYRSRASALITGLSLKVRMRVFETFRRCFGEPRKVIDVGVTSEQDSIEANFFERLFPHKDRVTAVGIEDGSFLERRYPGLRFQRVDPDAPLPFPDGSFDVAFSHAVIEHIVDPGKRAFFVSELLRVANAAFITTPNKFFWIEPHTKVPFLHFAAPRLFYWLLDRKLVSGFYNRSNLDLMSGRDLERLAAGLGRVRSRIERVKLFGITSNLILVLWRTLPGEQTIR